MSASDIHTRIKEARLAAGFSNPTEAVKAFGWTPSTYYGYENGDREPGKKMAERISSAFRVSLDWLLAGSGEMRRPSLSSPRHKPTLDAFAVDGNDRSELRDNDRIQVEIGVLRRQIAGSLGFSGIDDKQVTPIVDRVIASLAKPSFRSVVHVIVADDHNDPEFPNRETASRR